MKGSKRGPRFSITSAAWLAMDSPLSSSARLVLAVLGIWVNRHTRQCYPSIAKIVGHTRLSVPTVRRAVVELERAGAIRVMRGRLDAAGDATSHLYTVLERSHGGASRAEGARGGVGSKVAHPPGKSATDGGVQSCPPVGKSEPPNVVDLNERKERSLRSMLKNGNHTPTAEDRAERRRQWGGV
ncbi:MAG: helix-turn-helix domain-containing protein [Gemmatimonadetes bacterium]|nr:helix-turn-helix domain-containing protein [Gemmatimonadota bacterium]